LGRVYPCLYPPTIPHHIGKQTKLVYGPSALAFNASFWEAGLCAGALDQRIPERKELLCHALKQPGTYLQTCLAEDIER
jgi:hypothetical protein